MGRTSFHLILDASCASLDARSKTDLSNRANPSISLKQFDVYSPDRRDPSDAILLSAYSYTATLDLD
jgi:hypothetical protein